MPPAPTCWIVFGSFLPRDALVHSPVLRCMSSVCITCIFCISILRSILYCAVVFGEISSYNNEHWRQQNTKWFSTAFEILAFQGSVATRLRCGGIFNHCLALPSAILVPRLGQTMNELSPLHLTVFRIHEYLVQCVSSPLKNVVHPCCFRSAFCVQSRCLCSFHYLFLQTLGLLSHDMSKIGLY